MKQSVCMFGKSETWCRLIQIRRGKEKKIRLPKHFDYPKLPFKGHINPPRAHTVG